MVDNFRENRNCLFHLNSINMRRKIWQQSLTYYFSFTSYFTALGSEDVDMNMLWNIAIGKLGNNNFSSFLEWILVKLQVAKRISDECCQTPIRLVTSKISGTSNIMPYLYQVLTKAAGLLKKVWPFSGPH